MLGVVLPAQAKKTTVEFVELYLGILPVLLITVVTEQVVPRYVSIDLTRTRLNIARVR